jgi:hypothetical protein
MRRLHTHIVYTPSFANDDRGEQSMLFASKPASFAFTARRELIFCTQELCMLPLGWFSYIKRT